MKLSHNNALLWMDTIKEEDLVGSLKDTGPLKSIYIKAGAKLFRIYKQLKNICFSLSRILRSVHTSSLSLYLLWFFWGWLIVFLLLKVKG